MTRIFIAGIVLLGIFFLNGCAAIMSHEAQTMRITSQPEAAEYSFCR